MLRKIISILLAISLIVAVPVMQGFAADTAEYEESEMPYEGKALIEKLEIINHNVDLPSDYVTREMFALYVARMLKIDEKQASTVRYFSDVEYDSFAVNAINALVEKEIISVPENHLFRPGDYISQTEALKMLVCVLGYGTVAYYNGGYPNGYLKTANTLDIYSICENSDIITVAEAGNMIYQAMRTLVCEIGEISQTEDMDYIISYASSETFLEIYWRIAEKEGTVESVYGGDIINDGNIVEENQAIISGVKYKKDEAVDLTDYLGNFVRYFYQIKENNKYDEIIVVEKYSRNEDIVIDFKDFEKISGKEIFYYNKNEKLISRTLNNPVIVYNGSILGENLSAIVNSINKGSITLKDSNDDQEYDIVIIEDYRGFVISSVNKSARVIYDKLGLTDDIDFKQYEAAILLNSKGEKLDFSNLEVGQVLSVSAAKDKKYIKIIHETDMFNGVYKSTRTVGESVEVVIDDEKYELDKTFVSYFNTHCELNSEYTYTKDSFGKIVYVEPPKTLLEYGYVIDACEVDEVFALATKIKLLTADNEIKTYKCADKIIVDGDEKKSGDVFEILGDSQAERQQVILYSVSDDEIDLIDTKILGADAKESSMYDVFEGSERKERWYNTQRLGIKAILNSDTIIFCVPDNVAEAEEDDYFVARSGELYSDSHYVSDAYKDNITCGYVGAVAVYYKFAEGWGNNLSASQKLFVVDEISQQIYENDVVTAIEGYERGAKRTVYDDEGMDFSDVEKGDLLKFAYDRDGTLRRMDNTRGYEFIYDWSTKTAPQSDGVHWVNTAVYNKVEETAGCLIYYYSYNLNSANTEYYRRDYQVTYGEVISKKGTVLEWNGTGGDEYADAGDLAGLPIMVFDEASDTVFVGSIDDIIDRESAASNCSRIFFEQGGGSGKAAVIYNFE